MFNVHINCQGNERGKNLSAGHMKQARLVPRRPKNWVDDQSDEQVKVKQNKRALMKAVTNVQNSQPQEGTNAT